MERLLEAFQPGYHSYHPFRHSSQGGRPQLPCLQDLCKRTILRCVTLQDLKLRRDDIPLPKPLVQYLTTLSTEEFTEIECAPFVDIFDFNFYHRAVTYKVQCNYDGQEYLATHGATQHDWGNPFKIQERSAWIDSTHSNLMLIYGIAIDESTGNIFYIMNIPQVSLEHIQAMLFSSSLTVPELELWMLAYQLSSVLLYIQSLGLQYGPFGLDNIFLINDKVTLENELTRKSRFDEGLWARSQSTTWQPQLIKHSNGFKSTEKINEAQWVWYLGFVLSRFASTHGSASPLIFPIDVPQSFLYYKKIVGLDMYDIYSSELKQLIIESQNPDLDEKPSLSRIKEMALRMIQSSCKNSEPCLSSGLLKLATKEYMSRKQTCRQQEHINNKSVKCGVNN